MDVPVCKACLYENALCIRCNKVVSNRYKVTEYGAVCHSCSKYFRELKRCSGCRKKKTSVSNRRLGTGDIKLFCGSCYTSTLPICSKCKYRRKPLLFDFSKKPICRLCLLEEIRLCIYCNTEILFATGHICPTCSQLKTFNKRVKFAQSTLSPYLSDAFNKFCEWLQNTRNIQFAAENINLYFAYFMSLDKLANNLGRTPSYEEVVKQLSVAETRKNLLVTRFLDQENIIIINQENKDYYANNDSILRYLGCFDENSFFKKSISHYYDILDKKLKEGKTSIRSIRLALTPAVKLFKCCEHYGLEKPCNKILYGFLWVSPGQKSAITGFINYLNNQYKLGLELPEKNTIKLIRPSESRKQLKQKFLAMLRNKQSTQQYQESLLISALNYLHGVSIPRYAWVYIDLVKTNKNRDFYIRLASQVFYLPDLVVTSIK